MKFAVSLLLCLGMILTLSACTAGKEAFILEEYSATVSFDLAGVYVKGELNYKNSDDIEFKVIEPENLSGVSFSKDEIVADDVKISFSGSKEDSPVYILLNIIDDVAVNEIKLPRKGNFAFKSNTSLTEYKIIFDCQNGEISSIESGKFTYIFE